MKKAALVALALPFAHGYERIAGYSPASLVTQEAALDGDAKLIMYYTEEVDPPEYDAVHDIYTKGGSSHPQAEISLSSTSGIKVGDTVTGTSIGGGTATAEVISVGGTAIDVAYSVPTSLGATSQKYSHANCKVGGLPSSDQITSGCFDAAQTLTIGGTAGLTATQIVNKAGLTLQDLSTDATSKMRAGEGGPMPIFMEFADFFGSDDYGDKFFTGALGESSDWSPGSTGTATNGLSFSGTERKARYELLQKSVQHQIVWMWAYRQLEHAVTQCKPNCMDCNNGAVKEWDKAMAFYTGAAEGEASAVSSGVTAYFPHNQADKRGSDFMTCGPEGGKKTGTAQVNHKIFRYMQEGQSNLLLGNCDGPKALIPLIVAQMTIPLVQGTLRYADVSSRFGADSSYKTKSLAEGVAFVAAVAPRINKCPASGGITGAQDAATLWAQMAVNPAVKTHQADFKAVKAAFERHYACLNITCEEVGGHYDHANSMYYAGNEPCVTPEVGDSLPPAAIAGIAIGGGVLGLLCLCMTCFVCKLVRAEKKGKPVFSPLNPSANKGQSA